MRTWTFRETGEVRNPIRNEWYLLNQFLILKAPWDIEEPTEEHPILSLEVHDSDPMEGIQEKLESISCLCAEGPGCESSLKLFEAIQKETLAALDIINNLEAK